MKVQEIKNRKGFTMVELSISLIFIAILSMAVVLVITGAVSAYHRSITLNKVDTIGSSLVDDMQRSILESPATSLKDACEDLFSSADVVRDCDNDGGRNLASVVRYAKVKVGNKTMNSVPVFGAFCTGRYSYIWNSGYFFSDEYSVQDNNATLEPAFLTYKMGDTVMPPKKDFKLLKVEDENRAVCEAAIRVVNGRKEDRYKVKPFNSGTSALINNGKSEFNMAALASTDEEPIEYLNGEDNDTNLALYNLTSAISEQDEIHKAIYYYNSFILGTVQGGIDISAAGNNCATPAGYNREVENLDYCAINKFNFAGMAKGG